MLQRPIDHEYPPYFANYIGRVPEGNLMDILSSQLTDFIAELKEVTEDQMNYSYAENKWTLRQVLIHINDVERIFAYRALCCMRSDPNNIPGFEQDDYADITKDSSRSLENLIEEFTTLRQANISLFAQATDEEWMNTANLNGNKTTARSMAYMLAGHVDHHRQLNTEKYLA